MAKDSETRDARAQTVNDGNAQTIAREKAERITQGLAMMAQIETLTRQLHEARNGLTICADMAHRALKERERGASITVEAVSDIWRAAMIGKHRASDDFKGE